MNSQYLQYINSPDDLKRLSIPELKILAKEIRAFLIKTVSRTGGHLAPNLGVVELTIALHYVFDSPKDAFLWDVGHQSYVHKILTGRKDQFDTLRQKNGLSGFPNPKESIHDFVSTGHSSTSVSTAVGMATAGKIDNSMGKTLAIIGDGSFTSGMVYEALNDASWRKIPLLIILNDNNMSISENVGGIAKHLNVLRSNKFYLKFKHSVNKILQRFFFGRVFAKEIYLLKSVLKMKIFKQQNIFENLGVRYGGPYDGHDLEHLISVLEQVKPISSDVDIPFLLHVITKKGMGHQESVNNPIGFHGIAGESKFTEQGKSWSKIFGEAVCALAEKNKDIIAITAAMREGTGLVPFSQKFPERFIDVGIAEQHAVTCASGLALAGKTPVVAIYSTFLQRAYDQLIHDVALENKPVIFCLDRAGLVPNDGQTHQGVFDPAYLRIIPNMTVMTPLIESEMYQMLEFALTLKAPVAIRYPKENASEYYKELPDIVLGCGVELEQGSDGVFVITGSLLDQVNQARALLKEKNGKDFALYHLRFIKPVSEAVLEYLSSFQTVVVIEESVSHGGVGEFIAVSLRNSSVNVVLKNVGDCFPNTDSRNGLIEEHGFSPEALIAELL